MRQSPVRKNGCAGHSGETMTNTELSVTTSSAARPPASVSPPPRFDPATAARLDRDATQHVEDARPEKTRKGYGADWNAWLRFCAEQDLPPAAVRSGTLVAFVEWCWTQPARPTQPGRLPGKLTPPRPSTAACPASSSPPAASSRCSCRTTSPRRPAPCSKSKVKAMEKNGETRGRGPAPALLVRHMERIAASLPDNRFGVRDLALMTLHFAIAGREHELAHLRVRDVSEDPEGRGLVVDVRVFKVAPRTVAVPFGSRAHLCPVRAWRRWSEELGPVTDLDSHAFRQLHNRWHTVLPGGLEPHSIGDILTRIGARAELDIRPTGRSPRRGLVTESSRAGNPDAVMERQGGWAPGSKVMRGYREADEAFKENALHGVL